MTIQTPSDNDLYLAGLMTNGSTATILAGEMEAMRRVVRFARRMADMLAIEAEYERQEQERTMQEAAERDEALRPYDEWSEPDLEDADA